MVEIASISFFHSSLKSCVNFGLTAHLDSDKPKFHVLRNHMWLVALFGMVQVYGLALSPHHRRGGMSTGSTGKCRKSISISLKVQIYAYALTLKSNSNSNPSAFMEIEGRMSITSSSPALVLETFSSNSANTSLHWTKPGLMGDQGFPDKGTFERLSTGRAGVHQQEGERKQGTRTEMHL